MTHSYRLSHIFLALYVRDRGWRRATAFEASGYKRSWFVLCQSAPGHAPLPPSCPILKSGPSGD